MAKGDATAVTILAIGNEADVTISLEAGTAGGNTYNFGAADNIPTEVAFSVIESGFDTSGVATTLVRLVYGRILARVPGTSDLDETDSGADLVVRLELSDYIYAKSDDNGAITVLFAEGWYNDGTIDGGESTPTVTNSSTRAYPAPWAMWADHDSDFVYNGTATPRIAVSHRYGMNKSPVAAVRFTADDGVTQVSQTVSTVSSTEFTASGLTAPHFTSSLDFSSMLKGHVDIDVVIYPWIGDAFTLSTDAEAYPTPNLTILKLVNDTSNIYGRAYAYVSTTGNDGSGAVDEDPLEAVTNPYLTVPVAAAALQTYNNANFDSRNDASGGTVRLVEGTYTHATFSSVVVGDGPIIIEAADPTKKTTTIYRDAGSGVTNGLPDKIKFKDITIQKNLDGNAIFLDSNAALGSENMLVTENCDWSNGVTSNKYAAWLYRCGRIYNINCTGDDMRQFQIFGTVNKTVIAIGSTNGIDSATYHALACNHSNSAGYQMNASAAARPACVAPFIGWCQIGHSSSGSNTVKMIGVIGTRGAVVVGSIVEQRDQDSSAAITINADSNLSATDNVGLIAITVVGARVNVTYQDIGSTTIVKDLICLQTLMEKWNSKSDLFPTIDAARFGNWPSIYKTGDRWNSYLRASNNSDGYGDNQWLGQIPGYGDENGTQSVTLIADFLDDQSFVGGNAGGGDYTPGDDNELAVFPAGELHYPVDLYGNSAANNVTMNGGAVFIAASATGTIAIATNLFTEIATNIIQ